MVDRNTSEPRGRRTAAIRYIPVFLLLILIFIPAVPVSANVFTWNGSNGTDSVQELINSSASGDSVLLGPGKYPGNIIIDKAIVFGALDPNAPPEIVSVGLAGITITADGVVVDGVVISGDARNGIVIQSENNRITNTSITGLTQGIALRSAVNNEISHNNITDNAIGIEEDRGSYSNTFSLNYFDNTVETASSSNDDRWYSLPWEYRYDGKELTGMLGNFWKEYKGSDTNGDGIGDIPYAVQNTGPAGLGGAGIVDRAPLIQPPASYTLIQAGNMTALGPEGPQPQENFGQLSGGPGNTGGPPGFFPGFLAQYWWIIPIAIILSIFAGIRYERSRKRRAVPATGEPAADVLRNVTVVTKTLQASDTGVTVHQHYAAHLPPALETKYPGAEYIAEGGVSRVFVAWDDKEHRQIAVKIPIRFDEVTGSQFTKELHIWQGLHHKNIVEIYAANIFPVPYIEMEYIGSSLAAMKFPLPVEKAVEIARGVAEGLLYAHGQGIVHRDIKPENILIAPDGIPKITDWGLSKAEGSKQSGMIGFSLDYAAPEQLAPNIYGEPGPWTDIYQLGVLFYEMLSGHVPFQGGGMGEVTHAILHEDPVPLSLTGPDAALIRDVIARCMAKRPADRYGSVDEILEDLKKIGK